MEVIPVVYMLKCVILAKYNSRDQTLPCILSGRTTALCSAPGEPLCPGCRTAECHEAPICSLLPPEFLQPSQTHTQ